MGGTDRILRILAGSLLLPIGLVMLGLGCACGWVNVGLGIIGLATGISGFCPLYVPFGISTARAHPARGAEPARDR